MSYRVNDSPEQHGPAGAEPAGHTHSFIIEK
jgi:hypothetical protein